MSSGRAALGGLALLAACSAAHGACFALSAFGDDPSRGASQERIVIPLENLDPWDEMDAAIQAIEANETAVDILVAQRRTLIGAWQIGTVIRELANRSAD